MRARRGTQQGLTLVDVLALLVVIAVLGILVINLTLTCGYGDGHRIRCENNLKQLYNFAAAYGDRIGDWRLPVAPGPAPRAHDSLNRLFRVTETSGFPSEVCLCPASEAEAAPLDEAGRFELTHETNSYAWLAAPLKLTSAKRVMASDKYVDGHTDAEGEHRGHKGGLLQLMTDGSVEWVPVEDLPPEMLPEGLTR